MKFWSSPNFGISGGGFGWMLVLVVTQNQFSVAWVILGLLQQLGLYQVYPNNKL